MNFVFFLGSKAFSAVVRSFFEPLWIVNKHVHVSAGVRPHTRTWQLKPNLAAKPIPVVIDSPPARTLRVVRVVENGQSRTSVGRMVISGRMADVCAELDRLAAREASESPSRHLVCSASC